VLLDPARDGIILDTTIATITLTNVFAPGTANVCLYAGSGVQEMILTGCYWNASQTISIDAGLLPLYEGPVVPSGGPLAGTAIYSRRTTGLVVPKLTVDELVLSDGIVSSNPTVTATTGTFTTVACTMKHVQIGNLVQFGAQIDITTAGTAAGAIILPLPVAASAHGSCIGKEVAATALQVYGVITDGTAITHITQPDTSSIIASGRTIVISGSYSTLA
jgi:hypothetical protein